MLAGMLLGIIFYRPIYQAFLDDTDTTKMDLAGAVYAKSIVKHQAIAGTSDSLSISTTNVILKSGASR